jgi:hypothetical protein
MLDETNSVHDDVARVLYPITVRQARGQVLLQLAVIAAFVSWCMVLGFPRQLAWTAGMITAGVVATAYDIRWWLWLRRATPAEAHARLQARDDREGGAFRFRLTLLISFGLFALWWFVRK